MTLTPDQQATLDKLTTWVDEGRKLFDLAAALGLGTVPGVPMAQLVFDGVDNLWDYADAMLKGNLTALQTAVKDADTIAEAQAAATFDPVTGLKRAE